MLVRVGLVIAALGLMAGCGSTVPPVSGPDPSPSGSPAAVELIGSGTVLDSGDGPELCLGAIAASLPPQCGGPKVLGWNWKAVRGERSTASTTWGSYVVIGTFDGTSFTLTRPAVTPEKYDGPALPDPHPEPGDRFATPCPAPDGGWRPVDPARTNERTMSRTFRAAQRLPGFADLWVDQSVNSSTEPSAMNDPTGLVVNVRVTGDVDAAQAALRETWGGALCVTKARRSQAELRRIQARMTDLPGMLSAGSGRDVVDVDVFYDDGALQDRMDRRYGAGVVRVHSALLPYPG